MDKEFGREVVRTFGARLRRVFEQDSQALPVPMAETLERLRQAERMHRNGETLSPQSACQEGVPLMTRVTSTAR